MKKTTQKLSGAAAKAAAKKSATSNSAAKKATVTPASKRAASSAKKTVSKKTATPPTRFAHPFYTTTPKAERAVVPGVGTSMIDHIKGKLQSVPAPTRTTPFTLPEIIGQSGTDEIEASGSILFHTCGDTGRGADTPQGLVAAAMETDFNIAKPADSPAFFFHLGDVIYGQDKDARYLAEFYAPYVHYPGKIVAIAGNHDGEVIPKTDPNSLQAFKANFCAPSQTVPPVAGTIFRQTMNQPGVYYLLDAPFVQIVALYSNAAENPGFISGTIPGPAQKAWLLRTLQSIAAQRAQGTRKALVIATHHPPFTAGGHSPSTDMLQDIDSVCQQAGILPDMHLSGHAHSYQRYTREVVAGGKTVEIPYVVVGTGGINDQAVKAATNAKTGDHTYISSFKGYGYLLVEVSATTIIGTAYTVEKESGAKAFFETFKVDLVHSTVKTVVAPHS